MNADELVGLLCVVAAFAVWLTVAVHRALRDAEWGEPEPSRLDRLDRPRMRVVVTGPDAEDHAPRECRCLNCTVKRHPANYRKANQ